MRASLSHHPSTLRGALTPSPRRVQRGGGDASRGEGGGAGRSGAPPAVGGGRRGGRGRWHRAVRSQREGSPSGGGGREGRETGATHCGRALPPADEVGAYPPRFAPPALPGRLRQAWRVAPAGRLLQAGAAAASGGAGVPLQSLVRQPRIGGGGVALLTVPSQPPCRASARGVDTDGQQAAGGEHRPGPAEMRLRSPSPLRSRGTDSLRGVEVGGAEEAYRVARARVTASSARGDRRAAVARAVDSRRRDRGPRMAFGRPLQSGNKEQ